jgi:hypothetical protein
LYLSYTSLGYKLRKQISKAIVRRSATIRTALEKYNQLAVIQDPPRPQLEYSTVVGFAWLQDFELLKHSRHDILDKPWSVLRHREVANKFFKVLGAQGELTRLNVEIRRLAVWVDYEDKQLEDASHHAPPSLSAEMQVLLKSRRRINDVHRSRLLRIYRLDGYSGYHPANSDGTNSGGDHDNVEVGEDDILNDEVLRLASFLDSVVDVPNKS